MDFSEGSATARLGVRDFEIHWISSGFRISEWISGFLDFKVDFWISEWISGFQIGFLDFTVDFWISGFQFGFLQTVYEISFVTDPSEHTPLNSVNVISVSNAIFN